MTFLQTGDVRAPAACLPPVATRVAISNVLDRSPNGRQRAAAVLSPVDVIARAFAAQPGGTRLNQELAVQVGPISLGDARVYVTRAAQLATVLADVIRERNLFAVIGNRKYVTVEAWTLLANMLGVHPIVVWSRPFEDGWEARVEVRNGAGDLIGAGEAMCSREEATWKQRPDFALRAMAQTRAISRALRNPLGFVVKLAGYETTPAEEVGKDGEG